MKKAYYGDYNYMYRVQEKQCRRMAKAARIRRQRLLIIIGVLITMLLCSFFTVKAFANTDKSMSDGFSSKQYKSVMIYCGDTVESIAKDNFSFQFGNTDRMSYEIRSINHISPDEKLIPGNYLVIPYYDTVGGY